MQELTCNPEGKKNHYVQTLNKRFKKALSPINLNTIILNKYQAPDLVLGVIKNKNTATKIKETNVTDVWWPLFVMKYSS